MDLEETYGAYRRSRRKRLAWAADNAGNRAISVNRAGLAPREQASDLAPKPGEIPLNGPAL